MADNDILRIVSELEDNMGKAVQLYVKNVPILAVGHNSHGDILDKILMEMSIPFESMMLGDDTYHAKKQGELYVVVGMGRVEFYPEDKKICLFGESSNYKLGINKEHVEIVNSLLDDFKVVLEG